jgi:chondroitin-sulfate-ABC endolyase/exolyase
MSSNAFISIKGEIPYLPENPNPKETSIASFVFWMYSPVRIDGSVRFSFLKEGKECCHFDYNLGFQGWRGSWVGFDRDMQGNPEIGMDEVRIYAPEGTRKGTLYFDGIITSSFQDVRYHTPDFHDPYVNEKTDIHWLILNNSWKLKLDIPQKESLDSDDIKDLETVRQRFITLVTEKVKPYGLKKAREVFDSYDISYNPDGTITGTTQYKPQDIRIDSLRQGEIAGIHEITYDSSADFIRIIHYAKDRSGLALGAVLAAEYTVNHKGFLKMDDLMDSLS